MFHVYNIKFYLLFAAQYAHHQKFSFFLSIHSWSILPWTLTFSNVSYLFSFPDVKQEGYKELELGN